MTATGNICSLVALLNSPIFLCQLLVPTALRLVGLAQDKQPSQHARSAFAQGGPGVGRDTVPDLPHFTYATHVTQSSSAVQEAQLVFIGRQPATSVPTPPQ